MNLAMLGSSVIYWLSLSLFPSLLLGPQTLLQVRELHSGVDSWSCSDALFLGLLTLSTPPHLSAPAALWEEPVGQLVDSTSKMNVANPPTGVVAVCAFFTLLRLRAGGKAFFPLLAWPVRRQDTQDTQGSLLAWPVRQQDTQGSLASEWSSVRQLEKTQLAKCMKHSGWGGGQTGSAVSFLIIACLFLQA